MVEDEEVKIETEPFTKQKIDNDIKKIDVVYHFNYSKTKKIKKWIEEHKSECFWDEEIIYVHRYPSCKETFIGIKRLTELTYFI